MHEIQQFQGAPEALAALRARLEDLPPDVVPPLRINVPQAVSYLLRLSRAYAEDREQFVRVFTQKGFDPARHDDMEQRALALWQADVDYRLVLDPERSLPDLVAEATPLRKKMMRAAIYLWEDDEDLGPQVVAIREGRGHMDTADDLIALAALFDSQWASAAPRCAVTVQDLVAARRLGLEMMHMLNPDVRQDATARARRLRDRAGAYALLGARDIRLAAAYVFRDHPTRLESYPNPLGRPAYRRPATPPVEVEPEPGPDTGPIGH
jgi:hypothetical protein